MKTLVIGHRNPDMDSICSAIGYAEFKRATGMEGAVAARCGNTNQRIDFALNKFGLEAPVFFADVYPRIEDVMQRNVVSIHRDAPVYQAMTRFGEDKFRGLPVVDDGRNCIGLLSAFKLGKYLFPPIENLSSSRIVEASITHIREAIRGMLITGREDAIIRPRTLVVAAMLTDSFKKRLEQLDIPSTVLIVGDRWNIQELSILAGVPAIVITNNFSPPDKILALAQEHGTTLLSSPHDTATTTLLARAAVTAGQMLSSDFACLSVDATLRQTRHDIAMTSQFVFPVLGPQGRMQGIISKSDLLRPAPRQLILVDHNELTQAVAGAEEVPIVEILDHHRIGVAPTQQPILFMNRPVGSTSTIVADCFRQARLPISKPIAGLLMCGMISDTLNLTSPTTTDVDREIMQELSKICGVKPTDLASEIFSVGSPLLTLSTKEVVTADCKEYDERGILFSVSQIEEISFAQVERQRAALLEEMEKYRVSHNYFFSALLITDVNTQNSILLVRGSESFTRLIDFPEDGLHAWRLDGIVSRKKQLLPYLTETLARMA
ncbi:MAG: putative manganese-dependent inorganic diphosphatase [Proteobacteria bacterium]|jgi:manganese-dependent inorganic pyrophosphatase|nr:putative manganese-dependent inorganic diphosphatase [Pseudomonadota bacterium]